MSVERKPRPIPQVDTLPDPDANFEIEVSDFKFVTRGIKNGKALRFSVTWKFEHPKYGLLGETEEGWLCIRTRDGLRVAPPLTRIGPQQSKQLKLITTGYHDLVLGLIASYRTKSGTGYVDYIGNALPEELMAKAAQDVDSELPKEILG